ncbi:MAG: hypothetical protein JWQ60_1280, partial [Pseudonocardia sp.]|nr:hypothetical protein [Pseudonocardia sp.]
IQPGLLLGQLRLLLRQGLLECEIVDPCQYLTGLYLVADFDVDLFELGSFGKS